MTFTQRGGNLPADEYSRAMRGSLIFFDRLAEHSERGAQSAARQRLVTST